MHARSFKQNINRYPNQPTPQTPPPTLLSTRRLLTFNRKNPKPQTQKLELNPRLQNPTATPQGEEGPHTVRTGGGGGESWTMDQGGGGGVGAERLTICYRSQTSGHTEKH